MTTKKKKDIQFSILWCGACGMALTIISSIGLGMNGHRATAGIMPTIGVLWFFYCLIEVHKLKYKEET